ncbi:MAG: type II secretion system minor pseudopilin GspJ [Gammaproteobacteria bacterium]|nr:type II secretion system minor pseudopilin GspJ [Gammaproteobacteria bacterium]
MFHGSVINDASAAGRTRSVKTVASRAGFTLMEMMTALAVFGVIGLMATQILAGTIRLGETTRDRGEALSDVQRAMEIIARDITQLTRRTVKDELGESTSPVTMSGTSLLELTRLGWQNPLGKPRSELQRVAYAHRDDTLIRLFWPVLDRAPGSEPIAQILLKGVAEASFTAHDDQGEQHGFWPLVAAEDEVAPKLAAIAMALRLERHGHIERLWLVPSGPVPVPDAGPGLPDGRDVEPGRVRS